MKEKIFITNDKGLKLAAFLHISDKNKPHPAVILLPGFTGYKEEVHVQKLAEELEKGGFATLSFDASGFGESEGSPETDYNMTNYLQDVENVYRFLSQLDYIDLERIGIWGHSMGGMISIIAAVNQPGIKAVCSVSPPNFISNSLSMLTLIEAWKHRGFYEKISAYDKQRVKISYDFILDSQKYKVTDYVDKLKTPLLLIIGLQDTNVDPSDTQQIFNRANQPKIWVEFPEMDHYYRKHPQLVSSVNKKVLEFFQKYL